MYMDNMTAKKLFGLICAEYKRTQKPVPRSYVREKCGGDAGLMEVRQAKLGMDY